MVLDLETPINWPSGVHSLRSRSMEGPLFSVRGPKSIKGLLTCSFRVGNRSRQRVCETSRTNSGRVVSNRTKKVKLYTFTRESLKIKRKLTNITGTRGKIYKFSVNIKEKTMYVS